MAVAYALFVANKRYDSSFRESWAKTSRNHIDLAHEQGLN